MDVSFGSNGRRASDDDDDDPKNANRSAMSASPAKSPARRRGSIEDQVKRRSIMEGLMSFQIPGEEFSEDVSDSDDESDDGDGGHEHNNETVPERMSAVRQQPPEPQPQYPPKTSRHVPQQQQQLDDQKRPRRSSFRSENSPNENGNNNNSPFSSKSVRFQVGDDRRIVKAGELSSHNKSLSLESVFALEDPEEQPKDDANNQREATASSEQFVSADSEKSSADRRRKEKHKQSRVVELQQKKNRMRKRSSSSKSDLQENDDEVPDNMDQSNKSHNSHNNSRSAGMDQSHNSHKSQGSCSSLNNKGMDQSHNSHNSHKSQSSRNNNGMDQSHNSHKSQNSRASMNSNGEEERSEGRRRRNHERSGNDKSRSSSKSKRNRSSSRHRRQSSRKTSSSTTRVEGAEEEIASSKRSSRKSSRSQHERMHEDKDDEPVDRRKLLARNSSLSELEVSAKRKARRRHSTSKLELQENQQQPYRSQSLRSLGSVKERFDRNNNDTTDVHIIDVGKVHKKETRRTSGTTGTETASESTNSKTKKSGSHRKLSTRESTRHRRTKIEDDGTEDSQPNIMDNSNSNSIGDGGKKRRGIPRGSSRSSLEELEGAGRETHRTKQSKQRKSQSRLQMHKSLGNIGETQTTKERNQRDQSPSGRRSRSEHRRKVDVDTKDTLSLTTSSFHEDRAGRKPTKQSSSRSLSKKTETSRRKGSYHSRMFVHEDLRSGEDDPVENLDMPVSDRDQGTGTSHRRRKSKKKVTPSHDTDTTAATSTTMAPIVPDEEKAPVLSFSPKQNRRLLRNASLNDMSLPFFDDDDDDDGENWNKSGRRPLEKRQHKSLRHVKGEPSIEFESDDNDRALSTVEKCKDRRRQPSTERGNTRRSGVRNERNNEPVQEKPRRARSSSRHRQKRSSSRSRKHKKSERDRSRSRSRSRSKTRARSRSRQHRIEKVEKEESNQPQQAPVVVDIDLPRDIAVDLGAPDREGGPDGECFSSIEGVSVELDRQKEEKKAKAAAKEAKAALKKRGAGKKDFNHSTSEPRIDGENEEKYDRSGEVASSPSFSAVLSERPVLLRVDSGISSIGFPDRKKRPPSRVPLDNEIQIPDSIVLGATEGEFMATYQPVAQTTVGSQSPSTKRQSGSGVEEPLTGSHIMVSSPSAIEDDLSESYYEEDEKEKSAPRWMSRLSTHALINVGMVDEVAKKASEHGGTNLLHGITGQNNGNSKDDGEYSEYSSGDTSFE